MPNKGNDFLMGDDTDNPATAKGPWFPANYDGECSGPMCGVQFFQGDMIRADGEGGWEGRDCFEDFPEDHA